MGYNLSAETRFMRLVRIEDRGYDTPCWIWARSIDGYGYGKFTVSCRSGKRVEDKAHRWSYKHFTGENIDGLDLHHKCEVKNCVNYEHLEPIAHERHSSEHHPTPKCKSGCTCGRHRRSTREIQVEQIWVLDPES